ncbi:MAG: ATP-binding protein [Chthoniobacter sp.]|uniref:ATP-binding protein n=1 Tax=Chthoniobacter sp. TaxID=2510640 RepID=UPI0032AA37B9
MKLLRLTRSFGFRQTMLLTAGCFALIALGVTGVTLVSRNYTRQGTRQTETLTGEFLPGLVTLARLQNAALNLKSLPYQFALAKDETAMKEQRQAFQIATVEVTRGIARLKIMAQDEPTQHLIADFAAAVQTYREGAEKFQTELGAGEFEKAMATLDQRVGPAQQKIETQLDALEEHYFELSAAAGTRTTALLVQSDHFGLLATIVLAGFTLLCLGLTLAATRALVAQVERRDAERQAAQDTLEKRVEARTEELAASLSILDATLNSTADGILAMNLSRKVVCYNTKFAAMWGIPPEMLERRDGIEMAAFAASQVEDSEQFLQRIEELHRRQGAEGFDVIELKDDRTFERYIQPQRAGGESVGTVANFRDITERKRAGAELEKVYKQLLETSRQAGMAEVATNVLHNVGNVLNSVNISAGLIVKRVMKSRAPSLARVVALLREHEQDLGAFIAHDERGKHLPAHLAQLSTHLVADQEAMVTELDSLRRNVEHIKDIVATQQKYAVVGGVKEMVDVVDLVEDSLRMSEGALRRHGVEFIREFETVPPMNFEKHKILQILVNLVRNAKHACQDSDRADKRLTLRVTNGKDRVSISVTDNGVGVPQENLARIFNHGFTTRKGGHGFGLHSGALAAREMGGSLTVQSDGRGQGATFTLELPCPKQEASNK